MAIAPSVLVTTCCGVLRNWPAVCAFSRIACTESITSWGWL
jgi:hypothetical protein